MFRLASLMIAEGRKPQGIYGEPDRQKHFHHALPGAKSGTGTESSWRGTDQALRLKYPRTSSPDEKINEISAQLIHILEKNNDPYINEFPIIFRDGRYQYAYDREIEKWKTDYEVPQWYTAKEAFDLLRIRYEIDETDPVDVQQRLLLIP
jgi:penicillin-binding protein 2